MTQQLKHWRFFQGTSLISSTHHHWSPLADPEHEHETDTKYVGKAPHNMKESWRNSSAIKNSVLFLRDLNFVPR